MRKYLQEACENVLEMLREKDKQNKSGSQVMQFEDEEDKEVDFVLYAYERFEQWKREEAWESARVRAKGIQEAEAAYQEEFAADGRGWNEV